MKSTISSFRTSEDQKYQDQVPNTQKNKYTNQKQAFSQHNITLGFYREARRVNLESDDAIINSAQRLKRARSGEGERNPHTKFKFHASSSILRKVSLQHHSLY